MIHKTAFPSRAKRLQSISQEMTLSQSYPLLKIGKIKKELFGELIENVNRYICSNLTKFYSGKKFSTVGEQKKTNPRLQVKNVEEYVNIMKNLKLEPPKMIDIALPANIKGTSI